ncbi:MAG TPA: adenosylcobalamin-dependent ribonucleoside-diphosphate reductase [Myxococcota bacterium]|jgi:ribonucleoside-diphosphate reductase alpha chain|nr:adenosylcobalamin-dependent ribonucleoside-diphosphate reductase [Myxococcota bacterium]
MTALAENALRVLQARYFLKDDAGRVIEDWDGLCDRVARGVAEAERDFGGDPAAAAESFRALIHERAFLPNSPTLMNAGTPVGQLAACFVLPVEDSLESIFEALKRMAGIHQSGGGTGFDFSRIRPEGDVVRATHGIASGPVSFLSVFDAATAVVKQGGRRRGANMGVLRIDHPDIERFVRAKEDPTRFTNFNLSVGTTDAFWRAVEAGAEVALVSPRTGASVSRVAARALLREVSEHAWASGDPGVIFLDALNRENPTPKLGALAAVNPCGELPLLPNEACNLGSLRLDAFARDGAIDWPRLEAAVDVAVRFLDDVIERSRYPYPEIAAITRANRKIGLGVMGFADLLVELGVPYDSAEAVSVADTVMRRVRARAERASAGLAEERGVFANFAGSRAEARGLRLRNATVCSIAPTGTLSILAGCAGGIEPFFALSFVRHVLDGARLPETNARFEAALRSAGAFSADLVAEIQARGSARGLAGVPEAVQRLFPIAPDIDPERHLAIQEAFQRHVDNAVSKTINLAASATPADVEAIYTSAWRRGLKGVTVFREGCKGVAVLVRGEDGGLEAPADYAGDCAEHYCA